MGDLQMQARAMSPPSDGDTVVHIKTEDNTKPALTPPTSESTKDNHDDSGSELSDLEPEEAPKLEPVEDQKEDDDDDAEIVPDHYYDGGKIPVFKPVSERRVQYPVFSTIEQLLTSADGRRCVNSKASRISLPRSTNMV